MTMSPLERAARVVELADEAFVAQYPGPSIVARACPEWSKAIVGSVLEVIREPSEKFAATLACTLADTNSPDGYADVSGANQAQGAKMAEWMREHGFALVKYSRDMVIDAAIKEA